MHFKTLTHSFLSLTILSAAAALPIAAQAGAGAKLVATVPAGAFPVVVGINPKTRKVYVPNNHH
jgi:DNA-binding beta-propeller fold protein YncE